jgi:hypothetical protein
MFAEPEVIWLGGDGIFMESGYEGRLAAGATVQSLDVEKPAAPNSLVERL